MPWSIIKSFMHFFYISNVLIINDKLHKHWRIFWVIIKYLLNQYVIKIICFPRNLAGLRNL